MISVISWENDGDAYATENVGAANLQTAKVIKAILKKAFNSSHDMSFGNLYEPCIEEIEKIALHIHTWMIDTFSVSELQAVFGTDFNIEFDCDEFCDMLFDFQSDYLGNSEHYMARVCESVKIFEIPEDIEFKEVI